ncbi:hypothetical protein DFJ43DRAFT_1141100 [Lentinula guzmanii]|uniref:BTB domain-containing protein n=1 Tax=Lentinula guzmanii TaxID=2804957 RepID=A0AA38MWZ2_9AGAR|nr:hypothetical protein DFJ43DRAFT_1141100 [Lentinula guzmanii]
MAPACHFTMSHLSKFSSLSSLFEVTIILGVVLSRKNSSSSSSDDIISGDPSQFTKDSSLKRSFWGIAYTPEGTLYPDCDAKLSCHNLHQLSWVQQITESLALRWGIYAAADFIPLLKVENSLFKVHHYFFERESPKFQEMLTRPPPTGQSSYGSLTNPVVLDVTSEEFQQLLWVFYNPRENIYVPLQTEERVHSRIILRKERLKIRFAAAYEEALATLNMEPKSWNIRRIQRPLPPPAATSETSTDKMDGLHRMETTEVSTVRTGRTNSLSSEITNSKRQPQSPNEDLSNRASSPPGLITRSRSGKSGVSSEEPDNTCSEHVRRVHSRKSISSLASKVSRRASTLLSIKSNLGQSIESALSIPQSSFISRLLVSTEIHFVYLMKPHF